MEDSDQIWSLDSRPSGQSGYVFYHEGSRELPLYWEYGGGDTIAIVSVEEPEKLGAKFPWAVGRERVILERILVRQQAPGSLTEIDARDLAIYVREQKQQANS